MVPPDYTKLEADMHGEGETGRSRSWPGPYTNVAGGTTSGATTNHEIRFRDERASYGGYNLNCINQNKEVLE